MDLSPRRNQQQQQQQQQQHDPLRLTNANSMLPIANPAPELPGPLLPWLAIPAHRVRKKVPTVSTTQVVPELPVTLRNPHRVHKRTARTYLCRCTCRNEDVDMLVERGPIGREEEYGRLLSSPCKP